ncbi:MAG: alpha-L-fucosidase [Prolixibacteraceae bacterium]|jgi:alpha-L-fucosidase|nr:alpha-L-fucosidase [Prolixibacteraceae bacterium]MBT6004398.1 alpha-L-fucosidase [Prolixibacteraceae bacterium]MBT6997005.1 alpha-L-fucosidase [Prolixibacteraceae bacterium]MBT7396237.1 alpha-L-fucosidase [Prolixibacteraceae bacterium]
MKRILLISIVLIFVSQFSYSQKKIWNETETEKTERLSWWTEARFGMFIHWGSYAQAARHEWVKKRERISDEEYQKYFEIFNPDLFDPAEWAKKAKAAGMKYAVITTKHHEGFNMFKSEYTDYNVTNTPYGKDIIKEWVDAFRAEGLGIGFYYSLIDWHHPEYTIDRVHPQSVRTQEEYDELNKNRDMSIYREYLKNQVREILTNYGKVDILWLDYSFPGKFGKDRDDWGSVELMKMVRKLQPEILVNDRADLKDYQGGWDFTTPEQFKVQSWPEIDGEKIPWETCQTFSGSWGYYRDEHTWKDNKQLLVLLIESVSKGGNVLLNVGPTARGTFDQRADKALKEMGEWMKYNSRSIYGCTQASEEFEAPDHTLLTYNPKTNRLYIHLLDYPMKNFLLRGFGDKVKYAQFLHDASEINIGKPYGHWVQQETGENDINLLLPVNKPNVEIPVIELFLK